MHVGISCMQYNLDVSRAIGTFFASRRATAAMRWALLYCACPCALSYTAVAGPAWPHAPTTASPQPRPLGVTPRRPLLRARVRPPVALFSFEPLFDSADPRLGQDLLSSEASWLLLASLGVLALGQCFEVIVHNFRRIVPRRLRAVLEAILGELTTLGFTGLVLGAIHDSSALDALSSTYLGEPEELYELIELVDASLFPAVVSYLLSCALLVGIVNVQFAAFKRSTQNELLLARLTDDAEREACRGEGAEEEGCIVAQSRAQKVCVWALRPRGPSRPPPSHAPHLTPPSYTGPRPAALVDGHPGCRRRARLTLPRDRGTLQVSGRPPRRVPALPITFHRAVQPGRLERARRPALRHLPAGEPEPWPGALAL